MDFRNDIANLYESILQESLEDLISEGSGSHGDKRKTEEMVQQGLDSGLIRTAKVTDHGWMLLSAVDRSKFTSHKGENNLHYIRRYLEKLVQVRDGVIPGETSRY